MEVPLRQRTPYIIYIAAVKYWEKGGFKATEQRFENIRIFSVIAT